MSSRSKSENSSIKIDLHPHFSANSFNLFELELFFEPTTIK